MGFVNKERDNSDRAIRKRYDNANEMAIVTINSMMFDSIRDVLFLLGEKKKLQDDMHVLLSNNEMLKEELATIKEELKHVKE